MSGTVGTFIEEGGGFRIDTLAGLTPMNNVLYNLDGFVCEAGQNGMTTGTKKFDDGETAVLIRGDQCALYLRDDEKGDVWCIGGFPYVSEVEEFCCRHFDAYTRISSVRKGIYAEQRVFVPAEYAGEIFTVTLTNRSDTVRQIGVVPAVRLQLNGFAAPRFFTGQQGISYGDFLEEANGYFHHSRNPWQKKNNCYCAVLCTNEAVDSYEGDENAFLGANRSMSCPTLLLAGGRFSSRCANAGVPFGALMIRKTLAPGESVVFDYALALVPDAEAAAAVYRSIESREKAEALFEKTVLAVKERHSGLTIRTPEKKFDYFVNTWLKKGLEYCIQKKSATRDNLQFAHGLTMSEPELVRRELLRILRYQYQDGHTVRSWQPMDTTYYSDGPVWIVMTVCGYLKFSGDLEFLRQEIPYFDGGSGTVYERLGKCVQRIHKDRGPHGLPLIRYADWNDALNLPDEQAESVFMAMGLGYMLLEMAELEEYLGHPEECSRYRQMHAELKRLINDVAWDEAQGSYIRGFSAGERVGASDSDGSVIYANPQSWSVIGGIVTEERVPRVLAAVDRWIDTELGCIVNAPPYDEYQEKYGRISAQTAGTGENGAVYCHATGFKAYADCLLGLGERAAGSLLKVIPDSAANPASASGALPYALTSCYNTNPYCYGRAGRPWLTGTQCWVMNTVVEGILGIRKAYGGFRIRPSLPDGWNAAECHIRRGRAVYDVYLKRASGRGGILADGREMEGEYIPFQPDGKHRIDVFL